MPEHRRIRRRAGWALLTVGGLTLAYMIIGSYQGWPTLTGVNLLALAAGGGLMLGTAETVRPMTWLVAVYMTVAIGGTLGVAILQPWELTSAWFRTQPVAAVIWSVYQLALVVFAIWVYRTLRHPALREALAAKGMHAGPPWVAFALGVLIVIGWGALEWHLTYSADARMAKGAAKLQHGVERTYDVLGMQVSDERGNALVQAYGPEGVDKLRVHWGELPAVNLWISPSEPDDADEPSSASSP